MNDTDTFTPKAIASIIEQLRNREDIKITEIKDEPDAVKVIGKVRMGGSWDMEKPFEGIICCMMKAKPDEAIEKGPPPPQELMEKIRAIALCAIGDAQGPVSFIIGLGEIIDICERQKDRNIAEIVQALDNGPYTIMNDGERVRAIPTSALKKMLSEPVTLPQEAKTTIERWNRRAVEQ